jgi:hypothetical protein
MDRRSFPSLHLNKTYECTEIIYNSRKFPMIEMRIYVNPKTGGFYQFKENIFKNHFITEKELRKLKLIKLNQTR